MVDAIKSGHPESATFEKVARSGRGGKRRQGGRKAGVPNKVTRELKELAKQYTEGALKELARLAMKAESEQARVAAIKELFDRAYGKSTQPLASDKDSPLFPSRIEMVIVRPTA